MQNTPKLERTQPIRPSKIGLFLACPLRYVFETERPKPGGLPPGPHTYLGTAFHAAIEHFWNQPEIRAIEIRDWIQTEFARRISAQDNGLCKWLLSSENIDAVISPSLVNDSSRLAHKQIAASQKQIKKNTLHYEDTEKSIFGIERRLTSKVLDLDGRADLVEKYGGNVHVVDFKLGSILTESNELKPEYLLQLAAYALIVKERLGEINIILELRNPKSNSRYDFDSRLENIALKTILEINSILPKNTILNSASIARMGEHCLSCSYRTMCVNYCNRLTCKSAQEDQFVSLFDINGTVISVTADQTTASVILSAKPDSRRIKISDIPIFMMEQLLKPGDEVYFFSLETSEVKGKGNYIANFHVLDRLNFRKSAFSCKVIKVSN